MSTSQFRGDLIAVGAIYLIINMMLWLGMQAYHIHTLKSDLYLAKTAVVELDADNDSLRDIISELNNYIDEADKQSLDQEHTLRLIKDLR